MIYIIIDYGGLKSGGLSFPDFGIERALSPLDQSDPRLLGSRLECEIVAKRRTCVEGIGQVQSSAYSRSVDRNRWKTIDCKKNQEFRELEKQNPREGKKRIPKRAGASKKERVMESALNWTRAEEVGKTMKKLQKEKKKKKRFRVLEVAMVIGEKPFFISSHLSHGRLVYSVF